MLVFWRVTVQHPLTALFDGLKFTAQAVKGNITLNLLSPTSGQKLQNHAVERKMAVFDSELHCMCFQFSHLL